MYNFPVKMRKTIFFIVMLGVVSLAFSAGKNKKASKNTASETVTAADSNTASFKLPTQKRTYFYRIAPEIVEGVEDGSPTSIRNAMVALRRSDSEYAENERVLIAISAEILKTVYPSEKLTFEVQEYPEENSYIGAINSANDGIFDLSTGNTDFLSIILPCLVLLKNAAGAEEIQKCSDSLQMALALKNDSVLANYLMGLYLEKQKNYAGALNYYKTAWEKENGNQEIILAYVRSLRQTGDVELARELLQSLSVDSGNLQVLKQNAYVAFSLKDYDSAEEYVARVLQQTPNDLEFLLFRAKILIEKNDYIHAVSLLDVYSRQDSTSIDYLILRARVQFDWSKNTAAATETIEKALELYPDNIDVLLFAAKISSATDSPVAGKYADELSQKVLDKEPENQEALLYALEGLTARENWQEAYEISSRLVSKGNPSSDLILKHVEICIKLGKKTEAFNTVRQKYEAKPSDDQLLHAYIMAYSQTGSRDEVISYIDSLLTAANARNKSFLLYSRSFLQLTEEKALADLRSSLIANPRNSDSLFRLYEIYYGKADYRKAQYYLRQVVAINPNDSSVKQLNEALTKLMQ